MTRKNRHTTRLAASACLVVLCMADIGAAHAWTLDVTAGARRLFLHVGNGSLSGTSAGALNAPVGTGGFVNEVQVTVPVNAVGTGAAQPMTTNSTQSTSLWADGYLICSNVSRQVLIGAGYRRNSGAANATLTVFSPTSLTHTVTGDTIPFSQISWTVSASGSSTPNVIPAGTFVGGSTQTLATVPGNRYFENCHTYSYANSAVRAAGTYNGRVTYTLSAP